MGQVAEAAHALHEHGVIHRDVKPGNIMVTAGGGQAVLMDLGLAQLADDVEGRLTRTRRFVGTLRYASPEQVLAVGTLDRRTDVYSLGATLWELLTLKPMFGATDQTPDVELMKRIQHEDPERLRKHHPGIPRDLDAIVLKCLEKEENKRYPTAHELARDLRRFLAHEPVRARPVSGLERTLKWVRRHPATAAAYGLLALVIVFGLVGGSIARLWQRAEEARQLAEESRQEAVLARQETDRALENLAAEYKKTEQLSRWMAELLQGSSENPTGLEGFHLRMPEATARRRTVAENLQRGALKVRGTTPTHIQAAVFDAIGNAHRVLGTLDKAEEYLKEALEIRIASGADKLDLAGSYHSLGSFHHERGRLDLGDYQEAKKYYDMALEIRRQGNQNRELVCETLFNKAWLFSELEEKEEARKCLRQLIEEQHARNLPDQSPELLRSQIALECMELEWQEPKRWIEAVPKVISLVKKLLTAEHNEQLIQALDNFLEGLRYKTIGEGEKLIPLVGDNLASKSFAHAEDEFRKCLTRSKGGLGEQSLLAGILFFLAETQAAARKDEAAENTYQECLKVLRETAGYEHSKAAFLIKSYAGFLAKNGRPKEAIPYFDKLIKVQEERFGRNHFFVAEAKITYAEFLGELSGEESPYQKLAQEALDIYDAPECPDGPRKKNYERCQKLVIAARENALHNKPAQGRPPD
jgi:tetratricopeptide (TPR) repeat protein